MESGRGSSNLPKDSLDIQRATDGADNQASKPSRPKAKRTKTPPPLRSPKHGSYQREYADIMQRRHDISYTAQELDFRRDVHDVIKQDDKYIRGQGTKTTRENNKAEEVREQEGITRKDFANTDAPDPIEKAIKDRMPQWERKAGERAGSRSDKGFDFSG